MRRMIWLVAGVIVAAGGGARGDGVGTGVEVNGCGAEHELRDSPRFAFAGWANAAAVESCVLRAAGQVACGKL